MNDKNIIIGEDLKLRGKYKVVIYYRGERNERIANIHEYIGVGREKTIRKHKFIARRNKSLRFFVIKNLGNFLFYPKVYLEKYAREYIKLYKEMLLNGEVKPPLKIETIEKKRAKGSLYPDIPLVDTGEMINSITYKVERIG